jgi:hypothetical protein
MITVADINQNLRDSAYAAVGLGVLAFQKAQVRRQELLEQLRAQRAQMDGSTEAGQSQLVALRDQVLALLKDLDRRVQPVRAELVKFLDELEARLPADARGAAHEARRVVAEQETNLRKVVGLD